MAYQNVAILGLAAVLMMSCITPSLAQTQNLTELQRALSTREQIIVTVADGTVVEGRVVAVSTESVELLPAGLLHYAIPFNEIDLVRHKDRLANGATNGFWAGLGVAAVPVSGIAYVCHKESGITDCIPIMLGIAAGLGAAGAGIGTLVDAMKLPVIFRRNQTVTASVRPQLVTRHGQSGILFNFSTCW